MTTRSNLPIQEINPFSICLAFTGFLSPLMNPNNQNWLLDYPSSTIQNIGSHSGFQLFCNDVEIIIFLTRIFCFISNRNIILLLKTLDFHLFSYGQWNILQNHHQKGLIFHMKDVSVFIALALSLISCQSSVSLSFYNWLRVHATDHYSQIFLELQGDFLTENRDYFLWY